LFRPERIGTIDPMRRASLHGGDKVKSARMIGWVACLMAVATGSWARDLPSSDPDRAALLDAARDDEHDRFAVRDLLKVGDCAFLCALKQYPSGEFVGSDGATDVYHYFFVRQDGSWVPISGGVASTHDTREVPCGIQPLDKFQRALGWSQPVVIQGEAELTQVMVTEVQSAIRYDLDQSAVDPGHLVAWELLGRRGITRDFSIEHVLSKDEPSKESVQWQQRACSSALCGKTLKAALRDLVAMKKSGRVSSLVWEGCWADLDLVSTRACVVELSSRPYCRPRMQFVADRQDIDRCAAEVRQRTSR
jgi:hypothetical protein